MSMGGTYTGTHGQNVKLINLLKSNGYAKGGQIGSLIKKTGEDGFILARTGEEVLSIPKLEIASDMVDKLMSISGFNVDLKRIQPSNSTSQTNSNINMYVTLPNVKDYETFKDQLLKSKEFEVASQNATIDKALGKNSLRKYNR